MSAQQPLEITDPNYKPLPGRLGNLTKEQEAALEQFKQELQAEGHFVPERMDDATLLRFVVSCPPFSLLCVFPLILSLYHYWGVLLRTCTAHALHVWSAH
jgi:hypothetical protein